MPLGSMISNPIPEHWERTGTTKVKKVAAQPGLTGFGGIGVTGTSGSRVSNAGGLTTVNTLTPEQRGILGTGSDLMTGLLSGQTSDVYRPFAPMSPGNTESFYNKYFRPEAESKFQNEVMPQIAESFVGPGTYWSGARAGAEADARQNFENSMMTNIGNMFMQNQAQSMQLLPFAAQLAALNTGVTYKPSTGGGGGGFGYGSILDQLLKQLTGQAGMPQAPNKPGIPMDWGPSDIGMDILPGGGRNMGGLTDEIFGIHNMLGMPQAAPPTTGYTGWAPQGAAPWTSEPTFNDMQMSQNVPFNIDDLLGDIGLGGW